MDTSVYLKYLMDWFTRLGGEIKSGREHEVKDLGELERKCPLVVNCTGVWARELRESSLRNLKPEDTLGHKVGLRPARNKVRLECEGRVIHNYGHGGDGFTLSRGCAEKVVELALKNFTRV